jgi:hypothetical protein
LLMSQFGSFVNLMSQSQHIWLIKLMSRSQT